MTAGQMGLLAGLLGVPLLLLRLGHRYRKRTAPVRTSFWGGVVGYTCGALLTAVAMMWPAVEWDGGPALREALVHWGLLALGLGGTAVGWLVGRGR